MDGVVTQVVHRVVVAPVVLHRLGVVANQVGPFLDFAAGRVALVTDAMAGAGLGDGTHRLGGLEIETRDGAAQGPEGVLAGSTLTMLAAIRNLHALGAPLAQAVEAATEVPARVLRLPAVGRIAAGLPADVVVLTDELEIERVLVGGTDRVAL